VLTTGRVWGHLGCDTHGRRAPHGVEGPLLAQSWVVLWGWGGEEGPAPLWAARARAAKAGFHGTHLPAATRGSPSRPLFFGSLRPSLVFRAFSPPKPAARPCSLRCPPAQLTQSTPELCPALFPSPLSPLQPSLALFSALWLHLHLPPSAGSPHEQGAGSKPVQPGGHLLTMVPVSQAEGPLRPNASRTEAVQPSASRVFQVTGRHGGAGAPCEGLGHGIQPSAVVFSKTTSVPALCQPPYHTSSSQSPVFVYCAQTLRSGCKRSCSKAVRDFPGTSGEISLAAAPAAICRRSLVFQPCSVAPAPSLGSHVRCCKAACKAGHGNVARGLAARSRAESGTGRGRRCGGAGREPGRHWAMSRGKGHGLELLAGTRLPLWWHLGTS